MAAAQGASASSHLRGATVGVLSSRRWRAAYAIAAGKRKKDAARALVVRVPGAAREPLRHVRGAALLARPRRRRRLTRSDERLLRRGALALSRKPVVALRGALVV